MINSFITIPKIMIGILSLIVLSSELYNNNTMMTHAVNAASDVGRRDNTNNNNTQDGLRIRNGEILDRVDTGTIDNTNTNTNTIPGSSSSSNNNLPPAGEALVDPCNICQQEVVVGPCRALFQRYFFNSTSLQCEEFGYGGCGANDNNFPSLAACSSVCETYDTRQCS